MAPSWVGKKERGKKRKKEKKEKTDPITGDTYILHLKKYVIYIKKSRKNEWKLCIIITSGRGSIDDAWKQKTKRRKKKKSKIIEPLY